MGGRESGSHPQHDVVLSYDSADRDAAHALAESLRGRGAAVYLAGPDAQDIVEDRHDPLRRGKIFVAWYSRRYPRDAVTQADLVRALAAASGTEDATSRIVIVNPEADTGHLAPAEIPSLVLDADPSDLDAVASGIESRVRRVVSAFDTAAVGTLPPMHGIVARDTGQWVGRFPEMCSIREALGEEGQANLPVIVELTGPDGIGKSFLAREFALRFGHEYPGGIFWLRGHGSRDDGWGMGAGAREAERDRQFRTFAGDLGVIVSHRRPEELRAELRKAIERPNRRCLWIVDDLAVGLDPTELVEWVGPHPLAATLVTTALPSYDDVALQITLGPLREAEMASLAREPARHAIETCWPDADRGHPMTCRLASALLGPGALPSDPVARTSQEEEASDRLGTFVSREFADPLAGLLLRAVDGLGDDARDFLRLAAVVAAAPIPFHLVAAVMGSLRSVDRGAARRLAEAAIDEADRFALTEEPAGDRSVHPLVSRVIRWTHATDDLDLVRRAAVEALLDRLPAQYDPGAYAELEIEIVHARVLAGDASADPEAVLIGRVARYDLVRGSYDSGERLFTMQVERLLERRHQTDRDVIDAMSNLAGARFVVGDVDGTIDLYRRVLELREETEGPEADAVRVARGNLASTLTLAGEYGAARDVLTAMLDRNREALGPEHTETTNAAWELYQTLCELGERRTAHEILSRDLSWLLSRMPATLGADQRRVRRSVAELPEFE